jgi:hypothetical protein
MNSHLLSSREHPIEQKGEQPLGQGQRQAGVVRVTAADVISSPSSRTLSLQSFEELGIPDSFRAAVESELTAGEKIVWLGRPSRNPQVHPRNPALSMMGIGLMGLGLAVAVLSTVVGGLHFFPLLFAGVLALIGALFFFLPKLNDPTKSCRSAYVVTNRRAMLVEMSLWAMGRPKAKSYLPHELLGLERRKHPEVAGAGDLILEYYFATSGNTFDGQSGFMHQQGATGVGMNNSTPNRIPRGFFLLDQVSEVEDLIRTTLLSQLEKALDEPAHRPAANGVAEPDAEIVSVSCACGITIEAPGRLAEKSVKCPQCSAAVSIPVPEFSAADGPQRYREDGPIPADLKAKTLAELDPREKIVWVGKPEPGLVFVRNSGWLMLAGVGLVITLIFLVRPLLSTKAADAVVQQKGVAAQQAAKTAAAPKNEIGPSVLLPLSFVFVWVGIAMVPVVRWHFAKRTCYVLTNRRALVYKEGLFGPIRESYPPLEVANMRQSNSWVFSGCGDLIFRTVMTVTTSRNSRGGSSSSVRTTYYGFLAIPHVQEVATLVRETLIDRFVDKLNRASAL